MSDIKQPIFSIIVPVYNEELVLNECYKRLKNVLDTTKEFYEIIFINDGSVDSTLEKAIALTRIDPKIKIINFSRNFGHQLAITAGMDNAMGNAIIIIDADLQDPPEIILDMIKKWKEGYEVVYGKRIKRKGEGLFKKLSAKIFYRALKSMTTVDIPVDTGDFRLIDRKVCNALRQLPERNRYVRGLVSWVGFKQCAVEYNRDERFAGNTKYPLKKMLKFASDGITAFSYKPLKLATYIGVGVSGLSFILIISVIYQKLFTSRTIQGWASLAALALFFNGVVLIMLGIIGEYIGRIFDEVKGRPQYIISEKIGINLNQDEASSKE